MWRVQSASKSRAPLGRHLGGQREECGSRWRAEMSKRALASGSSTLLVQYCEEVVSPQIVFCRRPTCVQASRRHALAWGARRSFRAPQVSHSLSGVGPRPPSSVCVWACSGSLQPCSCVSLSSVAFGPSFCLARRRPRPHLALRAFSLPLSLASRLGAGAAPLCARPPAGDRRGNPRPLWTATRMASPSVSRRTLGRGRLRPLLAGACAPRRPRPSSLPASPPPQVGSRRAMLRHCQRSQAYRKALVAGAGRGI